MQKAPNQIDDKISPLKKELLYCLFFTFAWGLIAHGYLFFNNSISHDSIDEFLSTAGIANKKIRLGRFLVPAIHFLRGDVSAPWWIGFISLLTIGFSVFFIARIFNISTPRKLALLSGVLCVNQTYVTIAATYIHDLDCNTTALMFAAAAVFLWRYHRWGFIPGMVCVALLLGLYQSFLSVTITLIIIACILDLLNGRSFAEVFSAGLYSLAMLLGGAVLYLILLKIVSYLSGLSVVSDSYNSLGNILKLKPGEIGGLTVEAWKLSINHFVNANSMFPKWLSEGIQKGVLIVSVLIIGGYMFSKSHGLLEKLLILVLLVLMPIGMNVSHILSNGTSHDLMYYSVWLFYLLLMVLLFNTNWNKSDDLKAVQIIARACASVCIALMLWSNAQVANTVYVAKDFMQDANLSLFTRIVSTIEQRSDYTTGETPIAFIGKPSAILTEFPEQFNRYELTWYNNTYVVGVPIQEHYRCYFRYVLLNPAEIASDDKVNELKQLQKVKDMPTYPQKGSVASIDGCLVVKLGN